MSFVHGFAICNSRRWWPPSSTSLQFVLPGLTRLRFLHACVALPAPCIPANQVGIVETQQPVLEHWHIQYQYTNIIYTFTVSTGAGCCPQAINVFDDSGSFLFMCIPVSQLQYMFHDKTSTRNYLSQVENSIDVIEIDRNKDPTRIPFTSSLSGPISFHCGGRNTSGLLLELLHEWLALLLLLWI